MRMHVVMDFPFFVAVYLNNVNVTIQINKKDSRVIE